jgi:ribonuclease HI
MEYQIYTDGAYSPTNNSGAIAFVILKDNKMINSFAKKYTKTTNQRMEQLAVVYALKAITVPSNITLYSDSAYVVNTYTKNWKRKCNLDLWKKLDEVIKFHNKVEFIHVKGHNKNEYNEYCDYLARMSNK